MGVTRELVEDVAAELGINEPSLVEKDFHVVRVLSLLAQYPSPYFELIFAGGTCLSKILPSLRRMSEDVDLKVLPTEQGQQLKGNALRKELSTFKQKMTELLARGGFEICHMEARNNNHFIAFELTYSRIFDVIEALRPNIKIELTFCDYACHHELKSISSLIAQVMDDAPELNTFPCIDVVQTAAEKLVSLLRRTAAGLRGIDEWADEKLIRHVYDLHFITAEIALGVDFIALVNKTVAADGEQFGNKHKEFLESPEQEISSALTALKNNSVYKQQYDELLEPLVYAQHKPTFEEGLATVDQLARRVWGPDVLPEVGTRDISAETFTSP